MSFLLWGIWCHSLYSLTINACVGLTFCRVPQEKFFAIDTMSSAFFSGWTTVMVDKVESWGKRWVILKNDFIVVYEDVVSNLSFTLGFNSSFDRDNPI